MSSIGQSLSTMTTLGSAALCTCTLGATPPAATTDAWKTVLNEMTDVVGCAAAPAGCGVSAATADTATAAPAAAPATRLIDRVFIVDLPLRFMVTNAAQTTRTPASHDGRPRVFVMPCSRRFSRRAR